MSRFLREHTNPPVFITSAIVILTVLVFGVLFTETFGSVAGATLSFITTYFGWFLVVCVSFFLIFVIALAFTRYGRIRLGPDDSRPEFSTISWFAMLFTAGMGIGLVYFGVAEPVLHFTSPPTGEGGTPAAAREAMNLTFFHWLLHPWSVYIVFALSLAYFSFRRGLPLRPASALYPLIGDRIYGPIGHAVDVIAVFGTLFGLTTSLGFGAQQINSGLSTLFGIPNSVTVQIILIVVITGVAAASVVLGIDKGIRNLSLINLWLAISLAVFVLIAGPTLFIFNSFAADIGYYFQNIIGTSFQMFTTNEGAQDWQAAWTLFYWAWWISWAPFVGMFVARVSRGRTIRQFIGGVLLAPAGASAAWFVIFGETAINYIMTGNGGGLAAAGLQQRAFRAARPIADTVHTQRDRLGGRDHSRGAFLRNLLGLRLAGDRHPHKRRRPEPALAAAALLGRARGGYGRRPAGSRGRVRRRRPLRPAIRRGRFGTALRHRAALYGPRIDHGSARREAAVYAPGPRYRRRPRDRSRGEPAERRLGTAADEQRGRPGRRRAGLSPGICYLESF